NPPLTPLRTGERCMQTRVIGCEREAIGASGLVRLWRNGHAGRTIKNFSCMVERAEGD
ncbi:MAG: hypothetical protein ACI92S_000887, partial [Planctomycetaceae bacterium]